MHKQIIKNSGLKEFLSCRKTHTPSICYRFTVFYLGMATCGKRWIKIPVRQPSRFYMNEPTI